jgi:endonuclease/exonuclease/phosphatase family metal-dependent hydrolase
MTLLVPLGAWLRSRWSALALGTAAVAFLGVWDFNVPWRNLWPGGGASVPTLRILTCNVQFGDLKTHVLADLIREARPDIVFLQEFSLQDPRAVLNLEGWHVKVEGEYCLASRYPIIDFKSLKTSESGPRTIAVGAKVLWSGKKVPVASVHLMSPRAGLDAIISSHLRGLDAFRKVARVQSFESALLRRWVEANPGALLAGDFNLTPEHPMYLRDWSDFTNAFSRSGWGLGHTMFTRHMGLRIDHVLCGPDWEPISCQVGPELGSAHRPVIAALTRKQVPPD